MNEYFISYCFYLGMILMLLIGFGFGFHILVKSGWKNLSSKFGMYAFVPRIIGTPVHETGHLLFAVLTGSHIKEVKLFPKINSKLKQSGGAYVKFAPRNGLLGSISCFLCGIGPMLFCPFVVMVLMYFLIPELYDGMIAVFSQAKVMEHGNVFEMLRTVITGFFQCFHVEMFERWNIYVFLLLAVPIANECVLSGADVKNAGKGFILIILILLAAGFVISWFPVVAVPVITGIAKVATLLMCVLCLGLVFNLIHWIVGVVVSFLL